MQRGPLVINASVNHILLLNWELECLSVIGTLYSNIDTVAIWIKEKSCYTAWWVQTQWGQHGPRRLWLTLNKGSPMPGECLAIFRPIIGIRLVLRCKGKSFRNFAKQHLRYPYLCTQNRYISFSAMSLVVRTAPRKKEKKECSGYPVSCWIRCHQGFKVIPAIVAWWPPVQSLRDDIQQTNRNVAAGVT